MNLEEYKNQIEELNPAPETMSLDEYKNRKKDTPRAIMKRRQAALQICEWNKDDVELGMKMRRQKKQSQEGQKNLTARKTMRRHERVISLATFPVSYTLANRALYFYRHDFFYYVGAFDDGKITEQELDEIIGNINLMSLRKEVA
jgi:hypothetical protein